MEYVKLSQFEFDLSPLGAGTVPLTTKVHGHKRVKLIRDIYDLGINWFDTARAYGDSEIVLGEALQPIRNEVIIITKSLAQNPVDLATHIDESLGRLSTDYIDVFLFHGGSALKSEAFFWRGRLA